MLNFIPHHHLIIELTKRDFSSRYSGSFAGIIWSFIQPLFLLAVYTTAFGFILKARWGATGSTSEYALILFSGLIIFNLFSECLTKASSLVLANPNFVKKVVFPLWILPLVSALSAMTHALIAILVWLLGYILLFGLPHLTFLWFPVVLVSFFPVLLGVGWLLSAVGVYVRDIAQAAAMISHTLLFLTPIFYSTAMVPEGLQRLIRINPLTFVVDQFRDVMFFGNAPAYADLLVYFVCAAVFAALCLYVFNRLRPSFADMV